MPARSLHDKVALVTGAASGLGRATAIALAEHGVTVVGADVNEDAGRAVAEQVGGHFIATDVADLEQNRAAVAYAVERAGGLDLVYLNAGVATGCGLGDDFDLELYRRANGVNLDGVVFGTVAALPELRKSAAKHGPGTAAIVATASLAGLTSVPFDPIYAANKHGVVGLARSMGDGLAHEGIRFNAVCPGFAETAIIGPIRDALIADGLPIIPAEDVAAAVVELLSGDMSGEAWFVQAGRPAAAFQFRRLPGPRAAAAAPTQPEETHP